MSIDQWLRIIPLLGISVVLLCFSASQWVRAGRRHGRSWPFSWGHVSALFLFSLGMVAGFSVARIGLDYSERNENRVSYVVLWGALFISIWAFRRWLLDGDV